MKLFKTLIFSKKVEQVAYGMYVHFISESELGGCNIPQLMDCKTTIKKLKKAYPKQDLKDIVLITVKLTES